MSEALRILSVGAGTLLAIVVFAVIVFWFIEDVTQKKHGTPVWYLMAKDEGHGFAKKPNADFQFYATVQFIKQFLLN